MFTGIIETVGTVPAIERKDDLATLTIEAPEILDGVKLGDSIAVNGCCLTVTSLRDEGFTFDAIQETLDRTTLGTLAPGAQVNLERAMRADHRLDGHIVQGHVDGTGRVRKFEREGEDVRLYIACDAEISDCLVDKGSITIDGVSLTVVGVDREGFDVALIPHTLAVTTLSDLRPDMPVNLEADVLGKYVKRYLDRVMPREGLGG